MYGLGVLVGVGSMLLAHELYLRALKRGLPSAWRFRNALNYPPGDDRG